VLPNSNWATDRGPGDGHSLGLHHIRLCPARRVPIVITMTMLVQVDLRSGDRYRTCWVEPRVAVGDQITLKNSDEPKLRWDVLRVGETRASSDIKRGWDNNI
jgi:hypothetical protein